MTKTEDWKTRAGAVEAKLADPDRERGLYQKYRVERLNDATGKHRVCRYYVLDLTHDRFSAVALRAYAGACASEYPALARALQFQAALTDHALDLKIED